MASKRSGKKPKRAAKPRAEDYRFEIDAYTPETMPMARLAEYLMHLASILGEPKSVHFVKLETGSTVVVHRVEREAVPKVKARATAVRRGEAPRDSQFAYKMMNRMLREDNGSAVLVPAKGRTVVLRFPGREEAEETYPSVRQTGSIEGFVMRVGGTDETIPVLLESEGNQIAGCYTNKKIARQLAQRLFDPVRLNGQGTWARDAEGVWSLKSFRIDNFEWLQDDSLVGVVEQLRTIPTEWGVNSLEELDTLRHGRRHGRS